MDRHGAPPPQYAASPARPRRSWKKCRPSGGATPLPRARAAPAREPPGGPAPSAGARWSGYTARGGRGRGRRAGVKRHKNPTDIPGRRPRPPPPVGHGPQGRCGGVEAPPRPSSRRRYPRPQPPSPSPAGAGRAGGAAAREPVRAPGSWSLGQDSDRRPGRWRGCSERSTRESGPKLPSDPAGSAANTLRAPFGCMDMHAVGPMGVGGISGAGAEMGRRGHAGDARDDVVRCHGVRHPAAGRVRDGPRAQFPERGSSSRRSTRGRSRPWRSRG